MSSRHQRVFRKRGRDEQVICVNCNVLLKFDDGKSVYRRRYPLTNRLQDRKWDPSRKPGISILEGLVETNPELAAGNISQILSTMCICHDCTILLRQVVNNKFKVQNLLVELQQKIGNITNEMRLQTNKEAKETDKVIKCWACQEKFSKENTRYAMHRYIIDEMTVQEAIETVLPDESVTLQGTSKKYLLVCKNCFKFLNKIIVTQCQAETTRQSFMEKTNEDGLISKILEHGDDFDVLDYADNDNDREELEEMENIGDVELNPSDSVQTLGSVDRRTESGIELQPEKVKEENTEEKSLNPVTGSSGQGVKRKLEHTCSLTEEDASSIMVQEETLKDENSDELDTEINELNETGEREVSKRRKTSTDVLSILQSTNSQNDELEMNLFETELEEGNLIVDEEERPEPLNENILKKIVYHLQQNSFRKAINLLKKNSTEFEKEFQKLVVNYVRKEMLQCNTLESSDWTRLSALHSGDATLESYIEVFQENLPLLGAILSYSVSGQRQIDFTNVEKTTLLRLLTVMGVIASERSPKCCLVQSLNSIQMAEDGCTGELYNAFYGLGLCLKEKDTRELLATPDYKTHQVCWDLLKETQEIKGSATDKKDKSKAVLKDDDEISDIDEEDHDEQNLPADFADVCPYWKLPPQTALSKDGTSSEEWVLYYDTKVMAEAEPIRLIFEAAGVPYHECREPYEKIEIIGGKLLDYPTFSQPVVRKGNLTLSEIPVICRHLGELLDLCPDSAEDKIRAEQICQTCYNYLLEAKISLHGFDDLKTSQAEKEKDHIKPGCESFIKNRIPKFFAFFETALKVNNSNKGFFFGDKLTYADLVMLHTLQATEKQFPDVYKQLTDILQLKTFKDKITSLPNLKAYLESHRSQDSSGSSL